MKHRFVYLLPLCACTLFACGGTSSSSAATSSEATSSATSAASSATSASSTTSASSSASSQASSSAKSQESYNGIKVYCESSWTHIYAWVNDNKLCGDWPGTGLKQSGDWKYYEFPDISFVNLIFNNGGNGLQTSDLSLNKQGVYYYYNDAWFDYEPTPGEYSSYSPDAPYPAISEANYRTFYQLLVYSFADGNGDGIGDFKGIVDHLDYLKDLGIGALWLSPVQPCLSYHAYDATDYYSIKSAYEVTVNSVKYDFAKLLEECHKKDIKVIMDMVFNHTSKQHSWYQNHYDWYSDDRFFGDSMPELNFDKTEVRTAVKDVGRYWLNKGADGFRLDAAYWVYNSGSDRDKKNFEWWQEFSHAMKDVNPDCYLIGEVLDANHNLPFEYTACGFDSTFDFDTPKQTYDAFNGKATPFAGLVASDQSKIAAVNEDAIMARPLSNHDIGRFSHSHPTSSDAPYFIEDASKYKAAIAVNALTPGNTFVYYGDELGLKGTCEDTRAGWYYDMNFRTPMPFDSGRTNSVAYFENFHGTGVTTSTTMSGKTITQDVADPYSCYNVLKKAIAIKNASKILQKGKVQASAINNTNLIDYKVTLDGESVHFYCNTTTSQMTVEVSGTLQDSITVSSATPKLEDGKLTLPGCAIAFVAD